MSDIVLQKNLGALINVMALSAPAAITAGGAGDDTKITGIVIDRKAFGSLPRCVDLDVYFSATLAATKTLSVAAVLEHSSDNENWTAYATFDAAVVATGPGGGGTVTGVARLALTTDDNPSGGPGIDLGSASQYLRLDVTPDLSATGTDTATIASVGVFGGFDALPAPSN